MPAASHGRFAPLAWPDARGRLRAQSQHGQGDVRVQVHYRVPQRSLRHPGVGAPTSERWDGAALLYQCRESRLRLQRRACTSSRPQQHARCVKGIGIRQPSESPKQHAAKSSHASVAVRLAVLLAWQPPSWLRPSDAAAAARFACAPSAGARRAQSLRVRESRWRESTQPAPPRTAGCHDAARVDTRASCSEVAQRWRRHSPAAQPSSVTRLAAWRRPVAAAQCRCTTTCSITVLPSGARTAQRGNCESWRAWQRRTCCAAHRERRAAPAEAYAACCIVLLAAPAPAEGRRFGFALRRSRSLRAAASALLRHRSVAALCHEAWG